MSLLTFVMRTADLAAFAMNGQPLSRDELGRHGDWIQTYTGRCVWPLDPRPEDIVLEDVAHHLSMKCRFNGACIAFYPVAQHAVELSRIVPERLAFAALHHDDSEYILPDVCSPVKPFFPGWKNAERRATSACCKAFGVAEHLLTEIKPYDRRIVADECAAVMAKPRTTWKTRSAPLGIHIIPMSPQQAEAAFVARHNELLNSRTD